MILTLQNHTEKIAAAIRIFCLFLGSDEGNRGRYVILEMDEIDF